ncbi:hypothetical protein CBR_g32395 [Chara braunii]|uniref:DUF659 domain-containing protein n=1 Tax=Chara braunii TaxID=69332 RepID=A0A388JYH9_CHABU|nr:hypothetical protein CBR_g32395 [Chara braunii]|eukprot:GBG62812.1 hypothetical protein CBR_g32395 [Chara braunii]
MTKSRSEAVKKHFTEVGDSGRADKGNKQRICNYCDKPVAGTASRARDHFLKGSRCDVKRLRGVVPREKYSRRVKGRLAARSELGAVTGETAEGGSSEDDNEQRAVEGGVVDRSESAAGLRHATPQSSTGVVGLRQTTMEDSAAVITAHEQTQRTVDDWMTAECIPFNMMRSEYWDKMVHALMNAPKGFRYAKFETARTKRVEVTRGRVTMRVEELRREWPTTGCMLQLDGWTDRQQRPHINVMVSFPKGSIFWRSVCMSGRNKGASTYYGILKRAIEEIGAEAVVGVVMDNAAVCAAAGRMVEADHPHIFSVPCTAHSLDLIFESFAKITWVGEVIKRASEVAKFFTNLSRVRDLLLHYSNGNVVAKPGATQFATNFIMLSSLQGLYLPLRECLTDDDWKPAIVHTSQHELFVRVTHAIFDDTFWADIEKVMQTSENLLNLLKKVDGAGPTISKVTRKLRMREGGDLEGVGAPTRATRKRGRPRKAPVEEEEAGNGRGTRKRGRLQVQPAEEEEAGNGRGTRKRGHLQVQPAEEEEEAALENMSSVDKHGSSDGSSSSDESGAEHNENDGRDGNVGARDGSDNSDESGGGRGSSDGDEKDGSSSEEEDDSECEGQ